MKGNFPYMMKLNQQKLKNSKKKQKIANNLGTNYTANTISYSVSVHTCTLYAAGYGDIRIYIYTHVHALILSITFTVCVHMYLQEGLLS